MFSGRSVRPRLRSRAGAAIILSLGTITSGLRIEGFVYLGPLAENRGNAGALDFPITVPTNPI
jgi:hypothetical protein